MLWPKNIDDVVGEILTKGAQTPPFLLVGSRSKGAGNMYNFNFFIPTKVLFGFGKLGEPHRRSAKLPQIPSPILQKI